MKIRKWLAAATAGAMALAMAGCSDSGEDFFATAEAGNSTAEYTAEAPAQSGGEEEYDNAGRSFDNGATQLSMTNGQPRYPPPHPFRVGSDGRQRLDDHGVPLRHRP